MLRRLGFGTRSQSEMEAPQASTSDGSPVPLPEVTEADHDAEQIRNGGGLSLSLGPGSSEEVEHEPGSPTPTKTSGPSLHDTPSASPHKRGHNRFPSSISEISVPGSSPGHSRQSSRTISDNIAFHQDDDVSSSSDGLPHVEGVLSKWTNYIHGWQNRWVELKGGILSYYKTREEKSKFCRGTIDVGLAAVYTHEFDQLRFDVSVSDQVYYLRVGSEEERTRWVAALEETKAMTDGVGRLTRRGSQLSLISVGSTASASLAKGRDYADKFLEVKTYRETVMRQLNMMHERVSFMVSTVGPQAAAGMEDELPSARADILTLKATTAALMESLDTCIEMMSQREQTWQQKLDRAVERRRYAEEAYQSLKEQQQIIKPTIMYGGPDLEEGPHSALNEDEFHDALESGLDALEAEAALREQFDAEPEQRIDREGSAHRFSEVIEDKLKQSLQLAAMKDMESGSGGWVRAHEDGTMKVYRCEVEQNGELIDRLKAQHVIPNVTAREFCGYFYSAELKMDWEHTVERFHVTERFGDETYIGHSLHKRVWPSAQRESVVLSHFRALDEEVGKYATQNFSVEHGNVPVGKYVRVACNMCMLGETVLLDPAKPATRDNVSCHATYMAYVNPGGWAPPAAVRAVSKREYPKFLRNITKLSQNHFKDRAVAF